MEEEVIVNKENSIATRFQDAKWCIPDLPVTIVGLGGTGSFLANFLSKQEGELHLYENDMVEIVNVGTQNYAKHHVENEQTKLDATQETLSTFGNCTVIGYEKRFEKGDYLTPIVISCVDSFTSRKDIFLTWLDFYNKFKANPDRKAEHIEKYKTDGFLFMDTRMSAEQLWVYAVNPEKEGDIKRYLDTILDENALPDPVCTYKGTGHCGSMCASFAVSLLNNFIYNRVMGEEIREVPFNIKLDMSIMLYEYSN